jgi:hypothetical protein
MIVDLHKTIDLKYGTVIKAKYRNPTQKNRLKIVFELSFFSIRSPMHEKKQEA